MRSSASRVGIGAASMLTLAGLAWAAEPMLHEFLPPDPREDVQLGTTTAVGDLPGALETESGVVPAPDPFRQPGATERAYGRSSLPEANQFQPDRDTRPVPQVDYDDPFSPSVAPFKRLQAFDVPGADYTFRVADPTLRRVPVGGSVHAGDDPFYADLTVDLVAGEPVRVPSVGPGARVLKVHTSPQVAVELVRDGAENLFLRGAQRGRVRVLMQLAAPRAALGGALRDASWGELPAAPPLPAGVQASAEQVNRAIGVSRAMRFREVVERLVAYYRSFEATSEPLPAHGDVLLDIALSRKGVCRHRSFGFVASALQLRIPARLVTNEAHAWVEVHDGQLWHRIDLGGASETFRDATSEDRTQHTPPRDPFAWPAGSEPSQQAAARARQAQREARRANDGGAEPSGSGAPRETDAPPGATSAAAPVHSRRADGSAQSSGHAAGQGQADDRRPASVLTVRATAREVFRNQALHLEGVVEAGGAACPFLRVDVALVDGGSEVPLGAMATDDEGRFQGAVVVPVSVGVGEHEVVVSTQGDARCGRGRSAEGQER